MPKSAISKADRKPRAAAKPKPLHVIAPWSCRHHPDRSEIEAYIMGSGKQETIAEVRAFGYINAEATANFIVHAVNNYEKTKNLIGELSAALEMCLQCDGLTWEAEQEAELVLRHTKQGS